MVDRNEIFVRAAWLCEYCRCPLDYCPAPPVVDHILPTSKQGSDDASNLAASCGGCNGHKFNATRATDPATGREVALFHPRQDVWSEHFVWSLDGTRIIGITPTGRATVAKLQLNRSALVNLRSILSRAGLHPPQ